MSQIITEREPQHMFFFVCVIRKSVSHITKYLKSGLVMDINFWKHTVQIVYSHVVDPHLAWHIPCACCYSSATDRWTDINFHHYNCIIGMLQQFCVTFIGFEPVTLESRDHLGCLFVVFGQWQWCWKQGKEPCMEYGCASMPTMSLYLHVFYLCLINFCTP